MPSTLSTCGDCQSASAATTSVTATATATATADNSHGKNDNRNNSNGGGGRRHNRSEIIKNKESIAASALSFDMQQLFSINESRNEQQQQQQQQQNHRHHHWRQQHHHHHHHPLQNNYYNQQKRQQQLLELLNNSPPPPPPQPTPPQSPPPPPPPTITLNGADPVTNDSKRRLKPIRNEQQQQSNGGGGGGGGTFSGNKMSSSFCCDPTNGGGGGGGCGGVGDGAADYNDGRNRDTDDTDDNNDDYDGTINKSLAGPNDKRYSKVGGGVGAGDGGDDKNDSQSQASQPLVQDSVPCESVLNPNEDDEMKVTGYRYSRCRTLIYWLCICATGGILRLILHWWRHWHLIATHAPCPLDVAEKVLVQEDYLGKHQLFYVKDVKMLSYHAIKKMQETGKADWCYNGSHEDDIDEKTFHFSIHLTSAQFKYAKYVRIFRCKQLRYIWDVNSQSFVKLKGLDVNVACAYLHQQKGLSISEQIARRFVYGLNQITIPYRDVITLLFLEVLNPFYVFQVFSVILWFTYNYYYYAVVIMMMSAFGISMSIIQTKKTQDALRATVQTSGCALVLTDRGDVEKLDTQYLVPGDIIEIPSTGCTMHCDAALLSGNCILDESMLTGESVPVTKTPLPMKRDLIFDKKEHARHTLFCGTKVIQTRYIGSEKVLAIVINTGNITAKGGLIRSIIYPPPVDYKFEQDSYKFIALLGLIAGVGFLHTLVTKIIRNVDPIKIAVESLDLITIVVPPALPAAMTVGRYYAQKRLNRNKIHCISPRSINVSGSINCVCFDKTGTLTEDGLDMWGVVPKSSTNQFQIVLKQIERLPNDHFLFSMVTCHSITTMKGQMRGDPLDLKMFESTGWILEDLNVPDDNKYDLLFPTIVRQPKSKIESKLVENEEIINAPTFCSRKSVDDLMADAGLDADDYNDIGIVREFPFSSALQRMSVITRRLSDDHFNVYCKGSPEMIHTLCQPKSMPDDYFEQLNLYAQQGYRIIAMAYKPLERRMTYRKVQRIGRDQIENDLEFLGFVILENRLKPDTTDVIRNLTDANIRTVMVTGDNILTALSVARDCGIVDKKQSVITVNTRPHPKIPGKYELFYNLTGAICSDSDGGGGGGVGAGDAPKMNGADMRSVNSSSATSLETCDTWTHRDLELGLESEDKVRFRGIINKCSNDDSSTDIVQQMNGGNAYDELKMYPVLASNNYRFAMVGETWSIVREHFAELLCAFVTRGAIFARMSPDHKQQLIMELQALNYYVAMCGDGANDCGALKVAHTGISLSETESSIASPFTSRNPTIACVPKVIKEGRAALVTSFGIFKYMAAYSMVQFFSVMILYSIDSNLTDTQYLFIDLGLISIFAFFFGQTEAYDGPLVKQTPLSSLMSLAPLASIGLQLITVFTFQYVGWHHLQMQEWFLPFNPLNEDHLGCYENYTMFAISCFQYIILAFVFSKGAPYRKSIISNIPFCLSLFINLFIVIYLILYPAEWVTNLFELIMPPDQIYRYYMLIYGIGNFLVSLFIELFIVEYLLFGKVRIRLHNIEKSRRKYLAIENRLRKNTKWPPLSDYQSEICNDYDKTIQPPISYAEIGAEHSLDMRTPEDSVLNRFFESPIIFATPPPPTPQTVNVEIPSKAAVAAAATTNGESSSIDRTPNKINNRNGVGITDIHSLSDTTSESYYESAANDETIFDGFPSTENNFQMWPTTTTTTTTTTTNNIQQSPAKIMMMQKNDLLNQSLSSSLSSLPVSSNGKNSPDNKLLSNGKFHNHNSSSSIEWIQNNNNNNKNNNNEHQEQQQQQPPATVTSSGIQRLPS